MRRKGDALSYGTGAEGAEFRVVLGELAEDPAGWQGPAGDAFVALMARVLERRASRIRAEVGGSGVMADPSDVVSEAVMIVDGPREVSLAESARRILAMERPLGYVVAAVTANTGRAVLSDQMGVGSRQVQPGVVPVSHYEGMSEESDREFLDRHAARAPWSVVPVEGEVASPMVSRQFTGVLVGRFRARPAAVRRSLEIATDVALSQDCGAGLTSATSRRRLTLFREQGPALSRVGMGRLQTQAMGWLLFGTERHPEWSLLAECARSVQSGDAVTVTAWQARHARELGRGRSGLRSQTALVQQPALFSDEFSTRRSGTVRRSA